MDGIQFSFGIGAFPFAMMGGVSFLVVWPFCIVHCSTTSLVSFSQCYKSLGTDSKEVLVFVHSTNVVTALAKIGVIFHTCP